MNSPLRGMSVSATWMQVAVITFVCGFAVLGYLAYDIYRQHPPIPERVVDESGRVVFSGADVMRGQHVFQKYGLMQYGSLFGHGAYLGPDFTARTLHRAAEDMAAFYSRGGTPLPEVEARITRECKANRYDPETGRLVFTPGQVYAFERLNEHDREWFAAAEKQQGLQRPAITDPQEIRQLTAYFAWAAWVAAARRPDTEYSYTNNWPPEPAVGNRPTAPAILWSMLSLIALLGAIGTILFLFGRYDLLGWHRADEDEARASLTFRPPDQVRLTPAQRATAWYFLVVVALFLAQGLLGGLNAHYHADPHGFFGAHIARWMPYNLSRMWHVQLALFFVSASFLAMGIFIAPMIARREPRHQEKLAFALFGALVVVVAGSLLGEAASIHGFIATEGPWFWVGSQGWEYLDLGRLWQILLAGGMVFWVLILVRGMRSRLPGEHPGSLPYLFLYSALSIPLFYGAGMVFWKHANFAVMDFWRFWVVHLWVEDFLELFTTIMVAYIFVLLGVVRETTATRVVYLDVILYSVGGVIGTMHHMYFSGAPAMYMSLGAFFSAMEVMPLVLLTFEAWRFMGLGSPTEGREVLDVNSRRFPHKWAVMFLVAVGFWNFLGAGVFGFLINLPIISYYEIGTQFTANHGHGAMMGVYGMLAISFFVFVARYFIPQDRGSERAMKISFWSLNLGLAWMIFANMVPVGTLQLYDSVGHGYWHSREPEFFQRPLVHALAWLRLPGDAVFLVGGILPLVYLAWRMFKNRKRPGQVPFGEETEALTVS